LGEFAALPLIGGFVGAGLAPALLLLGIQEMVPLSPSSNEKRLPDEAAFSAKIK